MCCIFENLVFELYCSRVFQKYVNLKKGNETARNRRLETDAPDRQERQIVLSVDGK